MLKDARFWELQLEIDRDLAKSAREEGCLKCEGVLHSASYRRKPRGGPAGLGEEHDVRFSFCCDEDGCRRRRTPASLRFLGRKVYRAAVVTLVAAMRHGASAERMGKLRELLGVSRRTVERWRAWWRMTFARSGLFRELASRILPAVATSELPVSLLERFAGDERERLISFLRALGPITVGTPAAHAR
jgi:hypothetical protein